MKVKNVTKEMIKARQKSINWYVFKAGEAKEVPDDFVLQKGLEKTTEEVKKKPEEVKIEEPEEKPKEEGFLEKVTRRGRPKKKKGD